MQIAYLSACTSFVRSETKGGIGRPEQTDGERRKPCNSATAVMMMMMMGAGGFEPP